ncbi:MAG: c-type cytochrome [Anaerolineae bacterium]|nr:c-type cytochrome [Anaerolineae bacterium]
MANDGRRIAFYGLILMFSVGLCSTLLVVAASVVFVQREPQVFESSPNQSPTWQREHADTEWLVQQLDFEFTTAQLTQGQQVYSQHCASCHGPAGQGQFPLTPLEPDQTGRLGAPPHNETGHSWHHSDVVLIRYVLEGGFSDPTRFYPMPAFGNLLNDDQIIALLAYIKTMWTPEQRDMQRQLTDEEQELFSN